MNMIQLQYVLKAIDDNGKSRLDTLYLLFDNDYKPFVLGTGRYAKVLLASKDSKFNGLLAVKFITRDDSSTFNNTSRERFYQEIIMTRNCGDITLDGKFIPYVGFGCLGEPTLPQWDSGIGSRFQITEDTNNSQIYNNVVIRGHSVNELNVIFKNNASQFQKNEYATVINQFLGEFMVLEIAYGTLDDLLTFPQNSQENRVIEFIEKNLEDEKRELDHRFSLLNETLQKLKGHNEIHNFLADRGFDQIHKLSTNELFKESFRTGLLIEIFTICLETLDQIHRKSYAHRDLKPGNFLIKSLPFGNGFWLADLGHVAERNAILNGSHTRAANLKDPGALTPGTKGFRAPEQIASGDEITFEIFNEDQSKLWIYSPSIAPENGDCIESSDVFFDLKNKPATEARPKYARIYTEETSSKKYRTSVKSEYDLIPFAKKPHHKGYLLRDIGFHSDIFAMGCLLYHLFTDGKNAEDGFNILLNQGYLEQLDHLYHNENKTISCLAIAIEMCLEDTKEIESQLQYYFNNNIETELNNPLYTGASAAWKKHQIEHDLFGRPKQKTIPLSKSFNDTNIMHQVQLSWNSHKLPLLILWIIFSCCLRDRPDSICCREPRFKDSEHIFNNKETTMAVELLNRIRKIKTYPPFSPIQKEFAHSGAKTALEFFVAFRLFSKRLQKQSQPNQNPDHAQNSSATPPIEIGGYDADRTK